MMFQETRFARAKAQRNWHHVAFVWLMLFTTGCSNATFFPVSGKITHKDGTPVTAGLVIFEPVDQKISARGEIHADGSFQLGTHTNNDGAGAGEYKVLIAPPPVPEEGKRLRSAVHPKYQSLDTTPLKFTVTKDRSKNQFKIQVD
jgi:hypothetical protein